jgi:3-methylcrotonyl-CoA carboxylase beta subunit
MYNNDAPGAGLIAGIGRVSGVDCLIVCNDATVKGGTYYPMTVKKHLRRAGDRAAEPAALHLPRRLGRRQPAEPGRGVPRSRAFRPHLLQPGADERAGHPADRRRDGLVHGGGAYMPAMSDESIIVKNQGTIFLAGPPLVKAAIGEVVSAEDLGGGDVHTRLSGVADHLAQNDTHALAIARSRWRTSTGARTSRCAWRHRGRRCSTRRAARRDPDRHRKPFDVREIIARIVDGSEFDEFKAATARRS